jgi:hypothetical protein
MPETSKLGLPLVEAAQAQKHVTVNESLSRLDAVVQLTFLEIGRSVPPGAASEGDAYTLGSGASGVWSGQDGRIAVFANGGWVFLDPGLGWQAFSSTTGVRVQYDGVAWVEGGGVISANGAGFVHRTIEIDLAISTGASVVATGAIPANAIVYGVTGVVLVDIGGVTSLGVGVSGATDRYGTGIGTSAGAWLRGLTGSPLAYYAETDLVVTGEGGAFDGTGSLRLAVHFAELTLPRA